jgi:rRNA maturation endonuclease Nob1
VSKEATYTTSPDLIEAGMKRCDECGQLLPIEHSNCAECGAFVVMFVVR